VLPDAQTTVLALSDLGAVDENPRRLEFWAAVRREAEERGARAVALVLYPARRWPARLESGWHALEWQRARPFRRTAPGAVRPRSRERDVELKNQLLALLVPALRIEPALLRAARRKLDAQGADLGTELDVWLDARIAQRSRDAVALDPRERRALGARFLAEDEALRREVETLLSSHHASLSPLILAEELLACGSESGRQRALDVLAQYARRLDAQGLGSPSEKLFVERLSERQPADAWLEEQLVAIWALSHRNDERTGFVAPLPEGLAMSQVARYLDASPAGRWARIWQYGNELRLYPMFGREVPLPTMAGSHVADLPLGHGQVQVRWLPIESDAAPESETTRARRSGDAPQSRRRPMLVNMDQPVRLPLPVDAAARLVLETDQAMLRIEPLLCPQWASRVFRGRAGLWVQANATEFLWHEPSSEPRAPAERGLLKRRGLGKPAASGQSAVRVDRIERVEREQSVLWPAWARQITRDAYGLVATVELGERVHMRLRWIPAGRFLMGSPGDEAGRYDDEGPQHWVTLLRGFWLGEAPCTQEQWEAAMGNNPSRFKGAERPVEQVSWEDCQEFCRKLGECIPGLRARLPTEAEWEYACRAGTASAYNDGSACTEPAGHDPALERLGWFDDNAGRETHPVGKKSANAWGLCDMHGNVWEWCSDWLGGYANEEQTDPFGPAEGQCRVLRGGSWLGSAGRCRSAFRRWRGPGDRWGTQGFRLLAVQSGELGERSDKEEASSGRAGGAERSQRGRGAADGRQGGAE
jgi:formylglycine-generating enzyme required for sulfatase activity